MPVTYYCDHTTVFKKHETVDGCLHSGMEHTHMFYTCQDCPTTQEECLHYKAR